MSDTPSVLFASENLQLGGLLLVNLARLHREGRIRLAAVWSAAEDTSIPPLGANAHASLADATELWLPPEGDGALLGGVFIADYAQLARELGVPHHTVADVNARHVAAAVGGMGITLGVCCGHSQYFRRSLRTAPEVGWVNCHPSLLPMHRGPYPGFWELRNGEDATGISLHLLSGKFDQGPMLTQFSIPLGAGVTFAELIRRQGETCGKLVPAALLGYLDGSLAATPQPEGGSYETTPAFEDFVIDGSMRCEAISRFIAGMRGVGPVMVRHEGALFVAEAVQAWQDFPLDRSGASGTPTSVPGTTRARGRDSIEFTASDGLIVLMVQPMSQGQSVAPKGVSQSDRLRTLYAARPGAEMN